jgi:hypothetical protein
MKERDMIYRYLIVAVLSWLALWSVGIFAFFVCRVFIKRRKELLIHRRLDRLKIQYIIGSINREQYDLRTKEVIEVG